MKATLAAVFFLAISLSAYCQKKFVFHSKDTAQIEIRKKDSTLYIQIKSAFINQDTVFNIQKAESGTILKDSFAIRNLLSEYIELSENIDSVINEIQLPKFKRLNVEVTKHPTKLYEINKDTYIEVDSAKRILIISNKEHIEKIEVAEISVLEAVVPPSVIMDYPIEVYATIVVLFISLLFLLFKWINCKNKLNKISTTYSNIESAHEKLKYEKLTTAFPDSLIKHFGLKEDDKKPESYAKALIQAVKQDKKKFENERDALESEVEKLMDTRKKLSQELEKLSKTNSQLESTLHETKLALDLEKDKLSQEVDKTLALEQEFNIQQKEILENAERIIAKFYRPIEAELDNKSDIDETVVKPMLLKNITAAAFQSFSYCSIIAKRFTDEDKLNEQLLVGKIPRPSGVVDNHSSKNSTDPLAYLVREILQENKVEEFSSVFVRGMKIEL